MKNKKLSVLLMSSGLLLTACGQVTLEDMEKADTEIQKNNTEIIEKINHTQQLESEMKNVFNEAIQGEDLKEISKPTSNVSKNIEERKNSIDEIDKYQEKLNAQLKTLESYDDKETKIKNKDEYIKSIKDLNKKIDSYQEHYNKSVQMQEKYLDTISKKDAKPEELIDGIEEINKDYVKLQEKLQSVDTNFQEVNKSQKEFSKELSDELKKGN